MRKTPSPSLEPGASDVVDKRVYYGICPLSAQQMDDLWAQLRATPPVKGRYRPGLFRAFHEFVEAHANLAWPEWLPKRLEEVSLEVTLH